ncbi:hypothetical protein ACRJ4W_07775 [Streptomyces sp. GLT-R25]
MSTAVMDTVRYSSDGQLLDIHRAAAADAPTVLLWHGRGPAERDVLGALAAEVARLGATVIVPDWHPDAADGGRPHLEASLRFTRDFVRDPAKVVLVGWSLGGRAAMATALRPDPPEGWRPAAVVGIAARYNQPEPLLGLPSPMAVCAAAPAAAHPSGARHGRPGLRLRQRQGVPGGPGRLRPPGATHGAHHGPLGRGHGRVRLRTGPLPPRTLRIRPPRGPAHGPGHRGGGGPAHTGGPPGQRVTRSRSRSLRAR